MDPQIYVNGELVPKDRASVSVYDHGFLYGDGVFEGIRVYNGKVFRLRDHIVRLHNSARAIMLPMPLSQEDMMAAVQETVAANDGRYPYIRLVVSRGVGTLGLDPNKCAKPQVIIIYDDVQLYPGEMYQNGLEVVTAATLQNHPQALNPRIKSLNYLNNILAKIEAVRAGVPEAIMLNQEGYVCECTGDNIFIVRDGEVLTPPTSVGILRGITRGVIFEIANGMGIPAKQDNMTLFDVYAADECFLTGTACEIISVVKVDGREIGDGRPGPVTQQLLERFREMIQEECA